MRQDTHNDYAKTVGSLMPLPIPKALWKSIAMDLTFYLPKSNNGYDGIYPIIDHFNHFIPVRKTLKADHIAKLAWKGL